MCSRFTQAYGMGPDFRWNGIRDLKGLFKKHKPKYNIAPTDQALVIIDQGQGPEVEEMFFGMIPSWAKDAKMGLNCLNARSETISEKPSFRGPLKRTRCLIPVDSFFEWKREPKQKIPHRFVMRSGEIFSLAGLWDEWKSPQGKDVRSFAIVTCEPNALNAQIHDRMPVVLGQEEEKKWLNPGETEIANLVSLLKPYKGDDMESYIVSHKMNTSSYKEADSIERLI